MHSNPFDVWRKGLKGQAVSPTCHHGNSSRKKEVYFAGRESENTQLRPWNSNPTDLNIELRVFFRSSASLDMIVFDFPIGFLRISWAQPPELGSPILNLGMEASLQLWRLAGLLRRMRCEECGCGRRVGCLQELKMLLQNGAESF